MFGRLRPIATGLPREDIAAYQRTYCNLCGCLSRQHGVASRLLLVHDFATLSWLLDHREDDRRPFRRLNCLTGGNCVNRTALRPVDEFLAAISVYACGVKVRDDLEDERRWHNRLADRTYGREFDESRRVLVTTGFDIGDLESQLDAQCALELRGEADLSLASAPTGMAYSLVARHLAENLSPHLTDAATQLGNVLGRSVYLIDADRDCESDQGRQYNPLLVDSDLGRDSDNLAHRKLILRQYVASLLRQADHIIRGAPGLTIRWNAVGDRVRNLLGIVRHDVTLNAVCCVPCGNGGVAVSDGDCISCCLGCVCWGWCLCYCCTNR